MLKNGDAVDSVRRGSRRRRALAPIGEQENPGRRRNQEQPERETLESIGHGKGVSRRDLLSRYGRVSTEVDTTTLTFLQQLFLCGVPDPDLDGSGITGDQIHIVA
jgi:hypothetical protein